MLIQAGAEHAFQMYDQKHEKTMNEKRPCYFRLSSGRLLYQETERGTNTVSLSFSLFAFKEDIVYLMYLSHAFKICIKRKHSSTAVPG